MRCHPLGNKSRSTKRQVNALLSSALQNVRVADHPERNIRRHLQNEPQIELKRRTVHFAHQRSDQCLSTDWAPWFEGYTKDVSRIRVHDPVAIGFRRITY